MIRVEVGHVEPGEFGEAQAAAVEKLEDGGVAVRHPGGRLFGGCDRERQGKKLVDLGDGEHDGEAAADFGELHFFHRAGGEAVTLHEEAIKAPIRGELQPDVGPRDLVFHLGEKELAKQIRVGGVPSGEFRLGAEGLEGLAIGDECAGRGVAFDVEIFEESAFQPLVPLF